MLEEENLSSKSVYAFVAWIATIVSYVIYLIWALVPDSILQTFGFTYYPTRYYAIAIPAYLIVLYPIVVIFYYGCCLLGTPPPEDLTTIRDQHGVSPALTSFQSPLSNDSVSPTISAPNSSPVSSLPSYGYAARTGEGHIPDPFDMDPRLVSEVLAVAPLR